MFHWGKAASSARNPVAHVPLVETSSGLWFMVEVLYLSFPCCYMQSETSTFFHCECMVVVNTMTPGTTWRIAIIPDSRSVIHLCFCIICANVNTVNKVNNSQYYENTHDHLFRLLLKCPLCPLPVCQASLKLTCLFVILLHHLFSICPLWDTVQIFLQFYTEITNMLPVFILCCA